LGSDFTEVQGAAALLRDHGSDQDLMGLAAIVRKFRRSTRPRFDRLTKERFDIAAASIPERDAAISPCRRSKRTDHFRHASTYCCVDSTFTADQVRQGFVSEEHYAAFNGNII
jgi:hypothetical protein